MMYEPIPGGVEVREGHETIRLEAWGRDSLRVRVGLGAIDDGLPGALDTRPDDGPVDVGASADRITVRNGDITASVHLDRNDGGSQSIVAFHASETREELLTERRAHFWWPGPRVFGPLGGGRYRLEQHFRSYEGERLFGLGQRTHGRLDQKGMALDLMQRNSEVSIPFVISSRGYGFLWNSPAIGHVELATNRTRWVANAARQIDYWISAGTPASVLERYADATGHAPELPAWATGFWQSKLRYRTQEELLDVAREYHRRGLPLSVIVADFFHWTAMGDWRFDPAEWPDPAAMVEELASMGTRLMVSIWPLVSPASENFGEMSRRGLLVGAEHGPPFLTEFPEKGFDVQLPMALHDPTDPESRRFVWDQVREHYFDHGVRVWWLDACEPELRPVDPANLRFHAGPGDEVYNLYPLAHAQGFWEGMRDAGEDDVVLLCRSAWAGSQRYGAAVWSGDIPATWDSLRRQVRAGLNLALSGIPWWTSDIGGFFGGGADEPGYAELLIRWFQYGAFCPLFRLHGDRTPRVALGAGMTGGPNEVWSYGDEAYGRIVSVLGLRERIRPYIQEQMRVAHRTGVPPMRPLFVDHPDDPTSWSIDDQFLLGPDVLVAPVLEAGARTRCVYLPPGRWVDAWTRQAHDGGVTIEVETPLERIPVYIRDGVAVPIDG
jgi:alpha-D-xyloside xylohydrolase